MSEAPTVRVGQSAAVVTITLSRPAALNAITAGMLHELVAALETADTDPAVRAIVLTGDGRAFSAGVDLKALGDRSLDGGSVGDLLDLPARRAIELLTTTSKIVVAKVNGHCFTGALELAIACDLVVVADEAKLGDTHAKFGLRPTWGMSQRLIGLVGPARARDLSYTARTFSGVDAAAWGLATRSVPAAELDDSVGELLDTVLANSAGSLAAYKDLYRAALDTDLDRGLTYEATATYAITDTEQRLAGFR